MHTELRRSYSCAEQIARERAGNFYYAFRVLPRERRLALCAVYAFMRYCDDIADGNAAAEQKRATLERWRTHLDSGLNGNCKDDPVLPAFYDSVRRFAIPGQYFHWIIDGTEMDLTIRRYSTFEELYQYCFRVASTVGFVCLRIFGYTDHNDSALKYAEHCGVAFQLTNILRDIKEDAEMDRIYIPLEDLERFDYRAEDLRNAVVDDRFQKLMTFETDRAFDYYSKSRGLLPMIDEASRPALWAMMEIYRRILERIIRNRSEVLRSRITLPRAEKASILLRALAMRVF